MGLRKSCEGTKKMRKTIVICDDKIVVRGEW